MPPVSHIFQDISVYVTDKSTGAVEKEIKKLEKDVFKLEKTLGAKGPKKHAKKPKNRIVERQFATKQSSRNTRSFKRSGRDRN